MFSRKYRLLLLRGILWFLLIPPGLLAQDKWQYEGPMRIGPYKGQASYTYKIVSGDTLLDGPFRLEKSSLDELLETTDSTFSFSGSFKDHFPDDFWRFEFGEFQSERESKVVDYQYRVSISGTQEEASGLLKEGSPSGPWEYSIQRIENSEATETLFRSRFEFDMGVPRGSFQIENRQGTLVGRFLRDGFAHDEWTQFYTDELGASEAWNFYEGILQNIQVTSEGETKIWEFFGRQVRDEKVVRLDAQYLKALALYIPVTDSLSLADLGIFSALQKNDSLYRKIDGILSNLGKSEFKPELKVKLPYFPLDSLEQRALDSLVANVHKARVISEDLLNDSQLNLLKLTDEQASYLYASVKAISQEFLDPLGRIVENYQAGVLEFIPREEYILHVWPGERPSPVIQLNAGEQESPSKTFVGPGADQVDFSDNDLPAVSEMASYALYSLDSIQDELGDKLSRSRRQQELISLEEAMIQQDLKLNHILDSLERDAEKRIQMPLGNIRATADRELSQYASIADERSKLIAARELEDCLDDLENLALTLAKIPEMESQIGETYQDAVWNPFMAVIMNEEVKKRITTAYRRDLIPFFLDKVENQLSCENAGPLAEMMDQVHQRMLELREEDTSKLERKLRREQDPIAILELIGLETENLKEGG